MVKWYEVQRYWDYIFDGASYRPNPTLTISDHARDAARAQRGVSPPALMIHGMATRSGTVYVGELLRQHPDLYAFPNDVWEFPLLQHSDSVERLQRDFLRTHEQNEGKFGSADFLPVIGSGMLSYLQQQVDPTQRMLLKVPNTQRLDRFPAMFPHEQLLVLLRDGRDLVASTIKTWPQLRFSMVCLRWRRAAQMVRAVDAQLRGCEGYWLGRFEDAVTAPAQFVRDACAAFGLDETRFPFAELEMIPVRGSSVVRVAGDVVWEPVAKPADFRPIGHWHSWTGAQKTIFKKIAGQELLALGYCDDLTW